MLLVEHFIGPSSIHGLGVFTAKAIRKCELVWEFNPIIDRVINSDDLIDLPPHVVAMIYKRAEYFPSTGSFVLATDGDAFMNHSNTPSLLDHGTRMYAARDLEAGEELTCDYRHVRVVCFDTRVTQLMEKC